MKITELPESAFAVYSEKLKQKKQSKPIELVQNGTGKVQKKKNSFKNSKELQEMKEIGFILKNLACKEGSNSKNILTSIPKANFELGLNNSDIGKMNGSKSGRGKVVQNTPNKKSNEKIKSRQAKKNSNSKQKISKNHNKDAVVDRGDTCISETNNYDVSNTKLTVSEVENKKPLNRKQRRKENKKAEAIVFNQTGNFSKIFLEKNQNLSVTIENSGMKNTAKKAKKKPLLKKVSRSDSKRSHKQQQKLFLNRKIKNSKSSDWTNQENSIQTSKRLFEWLILPIKEQDFMCEYWEKQPLLIKREGSRKHYSELLSTPAIDAIFRENCLFFTKHVDVTSYTDGVRETHNLSGRAQANVVWDFYSNGCSVRLLNPQAFVPRIHALNASLQEYLGCFVGANVYLTPPNSQGFAPHYDDIEAFVLQIEGKKLWKVYPPRNDNETLPRLSSNNFREEDVGKPLLEVMLEPGDMLYFPRGFIHQASTVDGEHSLHITLSAYQKTAWVDLLEKVLPIALKRAATEDVEFRRGLPLNYLGLEHHGDDSTKAQFVDRAMSLMSRLEHFVCSSLGAGVDQMGAQFMHDALPPVFTPEEKLNSGLGGGLQIEKNGSVKGRVAIVMTTQVKLIRANICRLVEEENEVRLYHCLDNPMEYHADEPQFLVLPDEGISVITALARRYPAFVKVQDLPHNDEEALMTLVSDLWDAGLLLAKGMDPVSED